SSAGIWLLLAASVWAALTAAHLILPFSASWAVLAFLGLGVSLPSSPGFVGVVQAATGLGPALVPGPPPPGAPFRLPLPPPQFFPVTIIGLAFLLVEHVSLSEAKRGGADVVRSPRGSPTQSTP